MSKKNNAGIVIGTKDEAMWTEYKEACEARIINFEKALMMEREILKITKDKILLEKRK